MDHVTSVDTALSSGVGLESPHFVKEFLPKLVDLVRASRRLPVGEEHAIRSGSREFGAATKDLGESALGAADRIVRFLDPAARSGCPASGQDLGNFGTIADCIDNVLERVDTCLQDALAGRASSWDTTSGDAAQGGPQSAREASEGPGGGPRSVGAAGSKASGSSKPQVRWRHLIHNERTSFVPRISEKHNMQVPLAEEIIDAQRRAGTTSGVVIDVEETPSQASTSLPHPYEAELNALTFPEKIFEPVAPQRFERMEDTPLVLVSTPAALREMISEIKATCVGKEIAVDVEHHDFRTYRGFVCLVQISSRSKDWVVDPFGMFEEMHWLNEIFSDPSIVKVLHGADRDVEWLQRDFSVYIVNMFDTGIATRVLRLQGGFSLANLVSHFCGVKLDKQYQTADWRERPLADEMVQYARCDTHYLLYCYDRLRNALLTSTGAHGSIIAAPAGEAEGQLTSTEHGVGALQTTLERSTDLCRKQYAEAPFDPECEARRLCERFGSKARPLDQRNTRVLTALSAWRDRLARSLDESYRYLAPDACLWRIAVALPSSPMRLRSSCNPLPWTVQERAMEIVELIGRSAAEEPAASAAAAPGPQSLVPQARREATAAASATEAAAPDAGERPRRPLESSAPTAAAGTAMAASELQEWPARSCGAPKPVVHVAVHGDKVTCSLPESSRAAGAILSMLAKSESSGEEEEEDMLEDSTCAVSSSSVAVPRAAAAKLRSIQEAISFVAAPPDAPLVVVEVPVDAAPPPGLFDDEEPQAGDGPGLEQPLEVKRKRRKRLRGSACLENVVKATDPYGQAAAAWATPDAAAPTLEVAANGRETAAAAGRPKKKKRKITRASREPAVVDPFL